MSDKCETFVARWDHAMCSTCGAAHAPTPTPAPGLDLDAVDLDFRSAMEGPPGNRSAIKFYHETWPALIAEVRALRAAAEEREADMHARIRAGYDKTVADAWRAEVAKRDAEIARLTADLAAARAVPADVEAALCDSSCWICDREDPIRGANLDRVKAAIARAISDATVARGTVGGLLATAPVGSIVEFWHGATANQITTRVGGIDDRVWLWRYRNPNGEWSPWDYEAPSPDDLSQPGEIVPADPNQRGPLLAATAPVCPGPDCPMCNGEACDKCNPGPGRPRCDHDGQERHEPPTATPRCSCTHEAGDSICDAHPACSECGDSTARNVDDCADHCQVCASLRRGDVITDWTATCQACKARGQLPKGG